MTYYHVYKDYDISVIDESFDGILGILFSSKHTEHKIVIYSVYLPPDNSPWGRKCNRFLLTPTWPNILTVRQ